MKKELKRQIKEDEFRTGLERAWTWITAHRDEVRVTGFMLVILAVGAGALAYYQGRRAREAGRDFDAALEIFRARVGSAPPEGPEPSSGPTFATVEEKFRKAAAAFDGIERKYRSLPIGQWARYYGALCRIEVGDESVAEKDLTELAARRDASALEPALARLALAELQRRKGLTDKAIDSYRQLVDDTTLPLPRDHALMRLASILEEARRFDEARVSYRRLLEEFPAGVYTGEARRRAEYLQTAAQD